MNVWPMFHDFETRLNAQPGWLYTWLVVHVRVCGVGRRVHEINTTASPPLHPSTRPLYPTHPTHPTHRTHQVYRQQKYNLLREETEGYSKLLVLLGTLTMADLDEGIKNLRRYEGGG